MGEFDSWFSKCCVTNRKAWIVREGDRVCGLVIVKDETKACDIDEFADVRTLKVCTFRIADSHRGGRLGEHFLRKVLWCAYENKFSVVYLTAFDKQQNLRELLSYFGFQELRRNERGEAILYKRWPVSGALLLDIDDFDFHRIAYPARRSSSNPAYVIPIWSRYHLRLFPEATNINRNQLDFFSFIAEDPRTQPSNSIRKVYLSHSPTRIMERGSYIYFYMTHDQRYKASQHITCVGIVESYRQVSVLQDLISATAKKSVYSIAEQEDLIRRGPVKVLEFLMLGYCMPPLHLTEVLSSGLMKSHPQSVVRIDGPSHQLLQSKMSISFRPST